MGNPLRVKVLPVSSEWTIMDADANPTDSFDGYLERVFEPENKE